MGSSMAKAVVVSQVIMGSSMAKAVTVKQAAMGSSEVMVGLKGL